MKRSQIVRFLLLVSILAFMSWKGYQHQILGGGPKGSPSVDALCPLGGLESLYSVATGSGWLKRVAPSALILFAGVTLSSLLVGGAFCGWACPLGALQEFTYRIARKTGIRARSLPASLDKSLRYLKYLLLPLIIALTWKTGTLVIRDYDPWAAWMHLTALQEFGAAFVVLALSLLASLFINRFWCRYLCPLGAYVGAVARLSPLTRIECNQQTCISCGRCEKECPVGLNPAAAPHVSASECIACGLCVEECPKAAVLDFKMGVKRVTPLTVGLVGILLLFGSVSVAKTAGVWKTFVMPQTASAASKADAIFGWMTLPQVAETVGLSVEETRKAGKLPDDAPLDISIKKIPGVDDEEVRKHITAYLKAKKAAKTD